MVRGWYPRKNLTIWMPQMKYIGRKMEMVSLMERYT